MTPSILESTTILSNIFSTIQCHLLPYSDRAPNSSHQGHHEYFVTAAPRPRRDGAAPLYFKNSKSKMFCSDLSSDILAMMTHFSEYFVYIFQCTCSVLDIWQIFVVLFPHALNRSCKQCCLGTDRCVLSDVLSGQS